MVWRAAALGVASLPLLASSQDPAAVGALQPYWLSREKQANVANCVVDIGIAATFLGKAGVAINGAVDVCESTGDNTAACTAAVSGIVSGFAFGAAFISAAAAECRSSFEVVDKHAVLQEGCAAVTSIIVGMLTLMVNAGASIKDTCPGVRMPSDMTASESLVFDVRRLQGSSVDPAERRRLEALGSNKTLAWERLEEAARKLQGHGVSIPKAFRKKAKRSEGQTVGRTAAQNAACAFNVGQFTFLSARAGLMINYAVKDCSAQALYEGGNINQAKCIADVGRTIGAFGFTASGIAFTVFECPDIIDNLDAACAGSIINLVAATSELVANGADLSTTCTELSKPLPVEEHDVRDVADPDRRLSSGAVAETFV